MDLNAFLPSLEISGSTLDFVGMPLEIAMDSLRLKRLYNHVGNLKTIRSLKARLSKV